jgi:hypothetical protein
VLEEKVECEDTERDDTTKIIIDIGTLGDQKALRYIIMTATGSATTFRFGNR